MDLFATNEEIAVLEEQLTGSLNSARLTIMTSIAWFVRQSNAAHALKLADEVIKLLPESDLPTVVQKTLAARSQLIHAESAWLMMALTDAKKMAQLALQDFDVLEDSQGKADAHWLLAWIASDSGHQKQRDIEFELMIQCAARADDQVRLNVGQAALARWSAFSNAQLAEERYGAHFESLAMDDNAIRAMWSNEFLGVMHYCREDLAKALSYTIQAHKKAIITGQIYFAIVTAVNIADSFRMLNEHMVALDWMQRGLKLARQTALPRCIGTCLLQMSEILRQINNLPRAHEVLDEALTLLAPVNESRAYALALSYKGSLALDEMEYAVALEAFEQLESRANALQQVDFQIDYQRGQAHALSFLGKPEEAIRVALLSLQLTQEQGEGAKQIEILMMLADIYFRYPELANRKAGSSSSALGCLYLALELAENLPGYIIPSKLFEMLSFEFASEGDFRQAFLMSGKALKAQEKAQNHETFNRATTIQVLHEIERVREDGEHHRRIAITESNRSRELLQLTTTLEQLSEIGREITTHLDHHDIYLVLDKYVHLLMDVQVFKIYLLDSEARQLFMAYCVENGTHYPTDFVSISHPSAHSARCFRDGAEELCHFAGVGDETYIPGTLHTATGLYFPLTIGERKLGVMSVESIKSDAFGPRELLIFRSLCAFAAIGFDNSHTYQQLQNTQKQLVYHEKMAALGSIVAGVAHELNTPIGNGLLLSSSLHDKTASISKKFQENSIRRSELSTYLEDSERASYLIFNSFQTAADLVSSFKQVSVDQTTAQRRQFDLRHMMDDIVATMRNQFDLAGILIQMDIPEQVAMDSYPGPLGQVIMNLMQNALLHAFDGKTEGRLRISAHLQDSDAIVIELADNGKGIGTEIVGKIFDPFFTTKLGLGGNGLGLSISYNIVNSILRGDISVTSQLNQGTTFRIELPLHAPAPEGKNV